MSAYRFNLFIPGRNLIQMAKSTPIQAIKQQQQMQQQQQPLQQQQQQQQQPVDMSSKDDIKDVLQSLNSANWAVTPPDDDQQQSNESMPSMQSMPSMNSQYESFDSLDSRETEEAPSSLLAFLTMDIKLAAICALVFITVSQIPLEKIVYTYISLDKFPFSEVIIKAIIAGLIFFVLGRIVIHA